MLRPPPSQNPQHSFLYIQIARVDILTAFVMSLNVSLLVAYRESGLAYIRHRLSQGGVFVDLIAFKP